MRRCEQRLQVERGDGGEGGRAQTREEPRSLAGELELDEPSTEGRYGALGGEVTQRRI